MKESDIENKVCEYARQKYGAIPYKFTSPARRSVPDRIIIFPSGKVIFIEFKAAGKQPTEGQQREIARLRRMCQVVYIVDNVALGKQVVDHSGREVTFWG